MTDEDEHPTNKLATSCDITRLNMSCDYWSWSHSAFRQRWPKTDSTSLGQEDKFMTLHIYQKQPNWSQEIQNTLENKTNQQIYETDNNNTINLHWELACKRSVQHSIWPVINAQYTVRLPSPPSSCSRYWLSVSKSSVAPILVKSYPNIVWMLSGIYLH